MLGKRIVAYRVAHAQAIDNFEFYKEQELHNLGWWMESIFGRSKIYYDRGGAFKESMRINENIVYTEYGIQEVDAKEFNFPGY